MDLFSHPCSLSIGPFTVLSDVLTPVIELIDPVMGRWDDEVVRQTFWPQDVKRILSTLVHPNLDNIMAWHYDTRGLF